MFFSSPPTSVVPCGTYGIENALKPAPLKKEASFPALPSVFKIEGDSDGKRRVVFAQNVAVGNIVVLEEEEETPSAEDHWTSLARRSTEVEESNAVPTFVLGRAAIIIRNRSNQRSLID